uniref:Uncharacterized protein n=1 Tax=Arundo donax TaxID=35708 RepID=A0A0A9HQQ1_ARUDO
MVKSKLFNLFAWRHAYPTHSDEMFCISSMLFLKLLILLIFKTSLRAVDFSRQTWVQSSDC